MEIIQETGEMFRATLTLLTILFSISFCIFVTGCPDPGAGESAGKRLDDAAEEVKDSVEEAGDAIEDATDRK